MNVINLSVLWLWIPHHEMESILTILWICSGIISDQLHQQNTPGITLWRLLKPGHKVPWNQPGGIFLFWDNKEFLFYYLQQGHRIMYVLNSIAFGVWKSWIKILALKLMVVWLMGNLSRILKSHISYWWN